MRYFIITYGCQMNKSDSERIATVLGNCGYKPVLKEGQADLILVNMCSVRQSAVDRVFGLLPKFQKLKDKNKKLKTILMGCILKNDKKKFIKGFDSILNIKDLPNLPQKLNIPCSRIRVYKRHGRDYLKIKPKYQTNFSAFVPIMTGCNNFCSFCVVPYVRGREVSRPAEEITCEIKNLIKRGCKEIWLLGQNVNSYRSILKNPKSAKSSLLHSNGIFAENVEINFAKFLKMINEIPGNFWIRFTSSHPKDFSDELIETIASGKKIVKEIHLPIQSGDNEILKKMNRGYKVEDYKKLIKKIRQKIPKIKISTDIIVGFPGETKKQFENTIKLFKEIKFDKAYIAKYSPRSGTAAFKLKDNVSAQEKKRRWQVLDEILKEKRGKHA